MPKIKSFIACAAFVVFSAPVLAQTSRTYTIQMVVFTRLTPQTLGTQQWPVIAAPSNTTAATPARSATGLQAETNTLRNTPGYQVLWTGSWTQTWQNNGTVTLPISNGNNLQGSISVTLGHYFDTHTNLIMTQPTSLLQRISPNGYFNTVSPSTFAFQFIQDRRMKSGELNYLGNPVIGVLIKIFKA